MVHWSLSQQRLDLFLTCDVNTFLPPVSVPLNTGLNRGSVATEGFNVTYPSTPLQHENTSSLLNHFLSITILIKQLFYQVIVLQLVTANYFSLLFQQLSEAILVYCSNNIVFLCRMVYVCSDSSEAAAVVQYVSSRIKYYLFSLHTKLSHWVLIFSRYCLGE